MNIPSQFGGRPKPEDFPARDRPGSEDKLVRPLFLGHLTEPNNQKQRKDPFLRPPTLEY